MSKPTWERISTVFNDALEVGPGERTAFLNEACGDDDTLRREVEAMLAAHDAETPISIEARLLRDPAGADAMIGAQLGPYRIERLIGRGGMGDVYLAERSDEHFEHRVALKLIRPGFDSDEVGARFRQERQILAQLEHPNIAMLLDGGVADDGRPYLVMQYVDGVPITEYCDANGLDVPARLRLFRTVCQAVHAAHANLVVHRDLKPANILVTSDGTVKLLDFGIAKLLDPGTTSATRSMLMTPDYAAPEQISGKAITTATDVYALGVLLYQLLTGERPLEIPTTSPVEIERVIREVEPPAPSTKAGRRAKSLRGELDHIVLMALRKEPERRYQSALEFADDISRYVDGQTVRAQPDSVGYRLRKFIARHRAGVAVAAVIATLVAAFLAMTIEQSRRVTAERDRAQAEQAKAERIVEILAGVLSKADPTKNPGGDAMRVSDLIEQIEVEVDAMHAQPLVQARMWQMLSEIAFSRSRYDDAEVFLKKARDVYAAYPDRVADQIRVDHSLAVLVMQTQGEEAAEPLLRESVARHRERFGDLNHATGQAIQDLAGAVIPNHPEEAMALINEAMLIVQISVGPRSMAMAAIFNRLGVYYNKQADYATAKDNFEKSLAILEANVGNEHPYVLTVSNNIAACMIELGQWRAAERLQRELTEVRIRILGPRTQPVATSWNNLAGALAHQGKYDEALTAYGETLAILEEIFGGNSGHVSNVLRSMGVVVHLQGKADDGVALFDRAIAIDEGGPEDDTRVTWFKRGQRGYVRFAAGERDAGLAEIREALARVDELALAESDAYRADMRVFLATALISQEDYAEASALLREADNIHSALLPDTHVEVARDRCLLGAALALNGSLQDDSRQLLAAHYPTIAEWGLVDPLQRAILQQARQTAGLTTN